jgi:uncharacterized OsmC-like protein
MVKLVVPAAIQTLRCRTVAGGQLRQTSYIRDLPPQRTMERNTEDLSPASTAPSAMEALLAALGSCLAVTIHANALARGLVIHALELDVYGDILPGSIGFETVKVVVRLEADAPRDALDALVRHATLLAPVANTLHNPVHLDVLLAAAP